MGTRMIIDILLAQASTENRKMKTLLLFVLAVLAVVSGSVVNRPGSRYNLNVGYIDVMAGDRQLHRTYIIKGAVPNAVQYEDVVFRGNQTTRIGAVYAFEVGNTQYASARIISGGVGRNSVTIRFQTARGYGYYYQFEVFGR